MALATVAILAVVIGFGVGMQKRWRAWHGPTAAVIVIPASLLFGFDQALSATAPVCLTIGFLLARACI